MTPLPWIVFNMSVTPPAKVCRFGARAEAEMHAQSLNKITKSQDYKAVFSLN
ncbi:hypothetical protein BDGGKGIB_03817 [Nodularia sphaerocarpa UHCC 0038]|nr:hypothetical protein BDGGKGIB_03817 [Nodularia sphaerocarpa UHCC 0038]